MKLVELAHSAAAATLGAVLAISAAGLAAAQQLAPPVAPLGFLVGSWTGLAGGRTSLGKEPRGTFQIEPAAGGGALLRRDRTELIGKDGAPAQVFEQVMLIYPEGAQLRADYFDGAHVIHYTAVTVDPGRMVRFKSAPDAGRPTYSLTYRKVGPDRVALRFEAADPGLSQFHVIAEGEATRTGG